MAGVSFPQINTYAIKGQPIDLSPLTQILPNFWKGQAVGREAGLRDALSKGLPTDAQGNIDWAKAASIVGQFDPELGMRTAAYANKNVISPIDLMRLGETQRHNQEVEKYYPESRNQVVQVPDEYGVNQPAIYNKGAGTITPVGGNRRYRPMSPGDVDKLAAQGQNLAQLRDVTNSFKDTYGGFNVGGVVDYGKAAGTLGRMGAGTENMQEASQWWQGYDRYKNVIRKELYGTALTQNEQKNFEAADITPGMDPATIKHNLAIQSTIVERAVKKKADALKASGFNPEVIDRAYGVDTSTLTNKPIPGPSTGSEQSLPPGYKASAGEQRYPETGPVPSANDYQMLKQHNNDPAFRVEFEKIYGPGSVDRWLQNGGMGR